MIALRAGETRLVRLTHADGSCRVVTSSAGLLALALVTAAAFAEGDKPSAPRSVPSGDLAERVVSITVRGTEADVGRLKSSAELARVRFEWKNTTGRTIREASAVPSCKCTKAVLSSTEIAPGASLTLDAEIDLRTVRGHFGTGLSLVSPSLDDPMHFVVRLYRPIPPELRPRAVSFGSVPFGMTVRRHVDIVAVADLAVGELAVDGELQAGLEGGRISAGKAVRTIERFANADRDSATWRLPLTVTLTNGTGAGNLEGDVTVPVKLGRERFVLTLRFSGELESLVTASPRQVVVIGTPSDQPRRVRVTLSAPSATGSVSISEVSADSRRVQVVVNHGGPAADASLDVAVDQRASYDATIRAEVRVTEHSEPIDIEIPIRMRIVEE